ncbi:MAG: NADH-quinone oxidoreductase subunit N, partial [Muribaculaceae bacterium]|nr:NADH-quinone oxidoreductase subunit N [Muribaculaceae bacterium]
LYYYLLVVKAMYISDETPVIAKFKSSCADRIGLIVTVAGIILLGIVSVVYNHILTLASHSSLF